VEKVIANENTDKWQITNQRSSSD